MNYEYVSDLLDNLRAWFIVTGQDINKDLIDLKRRIEKLEAKDADA